MVIDRTRVLNAIAAKSATQTTNADALDINPGFVERGFDLIGTYTPTILAAANTAANVAVGDQDAVLPHIILKTAAGEQYINVSGDALRDINYFLYGDDGVRIPTLGDATTVNPAITSFLPLRFESIGMNRPADTALDTRILGKMQLLLNIGNALTVSAGATGWTIPPSFEVIADSYFGVHVPMAFPRWREYEYNVTGASQNFPMKIETGYRIRAALIRTFNAAGTQIGGGYLTSFWAKSGNVPIVEPISEAALFWRGRKNVAKGWNAALGAGTRTVTAGTGTGNYQRFSQSSNDSAQGKFWLPFTKDKYSSGFLDTRNWPDFTFYGNFSGACKVKINTIEAEPISPAVRQKTMQTAAAQLKQSA